MKVLIIDNGWNTYHILTPMIKEYIQDVSEVDLANGSKSAISSFRQKKYELVFLAGHCAGFYTEYIIEEIRKEMKTTTIIIYGKNFTIQEYQKFMSYHVFSLLNEPFQSEEVKKVLTDYIECWKYRREGLNTEREKLDQQAQELMERSFLCSVLLHGGVETDWKKYYYLLNTAGIGYAMIINIVKDVTAEKIFLQYEQYTKVIKESLPSEYRAVIGRFSDRRILVFVMQKYGVTGDRRISKKEQLRIALQIKKIFMDQFMTTTHIGFGKEKSVDKLYVSYEEALKNVDQSEEEEDVPLEKIQNKEERLEELKQQFYDFVVEGSQRAMEVLTVIYSMIQDDELTELKNKSMEIFSSASHIAKKYGQYKGKCINYMQLGRQLDQMQREEVESWLIRSISYVLHAVCDSQKNTNLSDMKKVTNYVSGHFEEDISLEDAAAILNLSPQYFSRIFKERMNLTFVDYLTSIRIQKAKEWLRYSNNTIQEICFKVGYKDPNYFTRVFKKVTGVTPRQYKVRKIR